MPFPLNSRVGCCGGCLLVAVAAVLVLYFVAFDLVREETFPDYASLTGPEGLITKGWIPPFIPEDAKQIRVVWDLDTNQVSATFLTDTPLTGPCTRLESPPPVNVRKAFEGGAPDSAVQRGIWFRCRRTEGAAPGRTELFLFDPKERRMWMRN